MLRFLSQDFRLIEDLNDELWLIDEYLDVKIGSFNCWIGISLVSCCRLRETNRVIIFFGI